MNLFWHGYTAFVPSKLQPRTLQGGTITAILMMVLGICVVAWGAAYKCSLYKSQQEQAKTLQAKLCTRASEAAKSDVEYTVKGGNDTAFILIALTQLFDLPVFKAVDAVLDDFQPHPVPTLEHSSPHLRRPPPQISLINA